MKLGHHISFAQQAILDYRGWFNEKNSTILFAIPMQYVLDCTAATGHNFSKRVSDNPEWSDNQNYTFGHEPESKLR